MSFSEAKHLIKNGPDFFISHAWDDLDSDLVDPLVLTLKTRGYKVWYDKDMWGSASGRVDEFLKEAILSSRHCIPILCQQYFNSDNCLMELETIFAEKNVKHIFPVWWKDIDKNFLREHKFGDKILSTIGINYKEYENNVEEKLIPKIIQLANDADGFLEYGDSKIKLFTDEVHILQELEFIIGKSIPPIDIESDEEFGFVYRDGRIEKLVIRKTQDGYDFPPIKLPESLIRLVNLRSLDIRLSDVPDWLARFKNLVELNLSGGTFDSLPISLEKHKKLYVIKLKQCNNLFDFSSIESILEKRIENEKPHGEIPIKEAIAMESLDLIIGRRIHYTSKFHADQTQLSFMEAKRGGDYHIINLSLYMGSPKSTDIKIHILPNNIEYLRYLEILNLNNHNLKTLPENIGNLRSLKMLFLENNRLAYLPESIGNLKSLEILKLTGNHFEYLPESIFELSLFRDKYIELSLKERTVLLCLELNFGHPIKQLQYIHELITGYVAESGHVTELGFSRDDLLNKLLGQCPAKFSENLLRLDYLKNFSFLRFHIHFSTSELEKDKKIIKFTTVLKKLKERGCKFMYWLDTEKYVENYW